MSGDLLAAVVLMFTACAATNSREVKQMKETDGGRDVDANSKEAVQQYLHLKRSKRDMDITAATTAERDLAVSVLDGIGSNTTDNNPAAVTNLVEAIQARCSCLQQPYNIVLSSGLVVGLYLLICAPSFACAVIAQVFMGTNYVFGYQIVNEYLQVMRFALPAVLAEWRIAEWRSRSQREHDGNHIRVCGAADNS